MRVKGLGILAFACLSLLPKAMCAEHSHLLETPVATIAKAFERLQDQRFDAAGLIDPSPAARHAQDAAEDHLAASLSVLSVARLSASEKLLYRALDWQLRTRHDLRLCQSQLWDVDHINGWQVTVPQSLAAANITMAETRAAALSKAAALANHVDLEIVNLKHGLAGGYSVPDSVVRRVVAELDAVLALPPDTSPLFHAANVTKDPAFAGNWRAVIKKSVLPAIQRYRSFLLSDYLPRARKTIGLAALPNGAACYAAYLHRATTLDWSPRDAFDLGEATVAQAQVEMSKIGRKRFGVSEPASIMALAKKAPENRFKSPQDLFTFSRKAMNRSVAMSAPQFVKLPAQAIIAESLPDYQQNNGIPSHYEAEPDPAKPARFRISLADWQNETAGAAEVTASHETVPGHHIQIATARALLGPAPFADIAYNLAYVEGWANYAERLAEETGIYTDDYAGIFRRSILGRSLVVDPGIHVFGWSRSRALSYMAQAGLSSQAAEDAVDRIAVQPAQLTTYESGGLEIFNLREAARKRLGARFRLALFHQRVLERGVVTLNDLANYLQSWDGR